MALVNSVAGRIFKMGSSGPVVTDIQLRLRALGYALKGTGYFGSATDTAVSTFQKRAGLTPDGQVGIVTARALDMAQPAAMLPAVTVEEIGRPLWLEAGIALIGTKEVQGGRDSPAIMAWAREEGGDIADDYTHDVIPWCALFANHLLTKVGLKGTETLWALDFAGKWPSVKLSGPAVGAFAPMVRNGGGHIIVVSGRDQHGNIMGLGGNQSDQVSNIPFPVSRLNKGFWWPESVGLPKNIGFNTLPVVRSDGKLSTREA